MEIRMQDIDDCLDRLEKIVFLFSVEWGNEPSAIAIYDSGLLQILTRLHALLTIKYKDVEVTNDITTFLEYEELSKRFQKIEEDLSFAITETYREVQIQSLGDAFDKLVDIAIDYPSDKPIVTPQELHERIQKIKFLTEDTYRILHFYVTHALIEIRDMLYLNEDEQRRTEMIRKGFRDFLNERKTEFGIELCYSPLCERVAGFFRDSLTEEISRKHWEQLYRIDKFTINFATTRGRKEMTRKDFVPELAKAVRELLASTVKLDKEVEDICFRYIQSYFVKSIFEYKMLAHQLTSKYSKEKNLIDIEKLNFKLIGPLLNSENINRFYEIIHRYNVIQCRMFPELKNKYELWFNGPKTANDDIPQLSHSRQAIYDAIMKYIGKGDWKAPATMENVKQFMNVVLGREPQKLDAADRQIPEKLWSLFEHGRTGKNTRIEIAWANIVGFLSACNLLSGGSTVNNQKFFGQGKELISNIDHGGKMEGKALSELKQFLEKYCDRIIKGI